MRGGAILETYAVTHQFSQLHSLLLSNSARYTDRRYPAWLRDADAAGRAGYTGLKQQLRNLRGLTAAGFAYYN